MNLYRVVIFVGAAVPRVEVLNLPCRSFRAFHRIFQRQYRSAFFVSHASSRRRSPASSHHALQPRSTARLPEAIVATFPCPFVMDRVETASIL